MRDILFRGKRKDNGEWVEGFLTQWSDGDFQIKMGFENCSVTKTVLNETVGQYIGKTDKNGQKIFTDDIVRFKAYENTFTGKIVFNTETLANDIRFSFVSVHGETNTYSALCSCCDDIEVIGNIHDNPELLEGV